VPQFTNILRAVTPDKFIEIFSASARQARETYFHRHNVRAPKKVSRMPKPGEKNQARMEELFEILKAEDDEEMVEEVLRSWLLTKRSLLAAALDHLGIKHDNGLTESDDVKKFEKLSAKEIKQLVQKLEGVAPREDIAVYLKFMGTEKVDDALGA
jgi:hypothetical protein